MFFWKNVLEFCLLRLHLLATKEKAKEVVVEVDCKHDSYKSLID